MQFSNEEVAMVTSLKSNPVNGKLSDEIKIHIDSVLGPYPIDHRMIPLNVNFLSL